MFKPFGLIVTLAALVACQDAMGPDRGDPAQYALSGVDYACSRWSPAEPTARLGLFDVSFPPLQFQGLNSTKGGPPPSAEQRHMILALGGTIVHEFQLPIIRAILPTRNVPRLFASRTAGSDHLAGVSDPTDLTVYAAIGYTRAITAADTTYLQALGVHIQEVMTSFPSVHATIPDSAVGVLRARAEIQYVEPFGAACLAK